MNKLPATLEVGIVFSLLIAFTPISHANTILDNLSDTIPGSLTPNNALAQVFTMPSYSGDLSQLELKLDPQFVASESVNVYLDTTTSGAPTSGLGTLLGTASSSTSGNQVITLSLSSQPLLSAGISYAIVIKQETGQVFWDYTTAGGSGGDGTLGGIYSSLTSGSSWSSADSGDFVLMDLEVTPVPEVPMTGAFMGFCALAIAVGHRLRRKSGSFFQVD